MNKKRNTEKQRIKYVEKVIREFKSKGWEISEVWGAKGNLTTATRNKKSFDNFKERVRNIRSYNKEREKIQKDYSKIEQRYENAKKRREREQKTKLVELYGYGNPNIKHIWAKREELGLNRHDFDSIDSIQSKILKKFKDDITNEIKIEKDGNLKQIGAFFKNVSEDDFVEERLKELYEIVEKDHNAMMNTHVALDYLYGNIIMHKYEDETADYGKDTKADDVFWRDVSKEFITFYKKLIR